MRGGSKELLTNDFVALHEGPLVRDAGYATRGYRGVGAILHEKATEPGIAGDKTIGGPPKRGTQR